MATANKSERLELRVSLAEKETLEAAAAIAGLSISAYLRSRLLEQAQAEIANQQNLILSKRDWALFTDYLDQPPPANPALKSALAEYHQVYKNVDQF